MHVRLTEDAIADLDSVEEYLAPRNPQGLQRAFAAIFTTISQLETFPFLGRTGRIDGTREIVVPHTPFMIIYSLNEAQYIDIDRIFHTRQKPVG